MVVKTKEGDWKHIGLFIIIAPLFLIGYLIIVTPLFFPAEISLENPLKINPNGATFLKFIFTHHKYNITKSIIDGNDFFIDFKLSGLRRMPYTKLNSFILNRNFIIDLTAFLSPELINSDSFEILVNYTEGGDDSPIFVNRKARLRCNKINSDAKLMSELLFNCIKK